MNRRIATVATIAITALGLTACSSAPAATQPPAPAVSTSAPAPSAEQTTSAPETSPAAPETSASEPSLAEACLEPTAKMVEASAELAKVSAALAQSDGKDPQDTVDAVKAMADYFGTFAESSNHPKVKEALTGIQKYYGKLADLLKKVLIDKDMAAAADAATIMTDLQKSMTAFQELCTA
ncbi:MAG: hypothetical protein VB080_09105 [Propionicimonas sp.]|uniref:hypothetical protein n=1 Tax=Propionicimonas sp. TaxID=1955623 RepID=UPI002B2014B4|nr:hypothetical protein [Propionicimonas sp.]MEA4944580.1 hypothetical protein [Propionicimonas sp.]MEA5116263.1 hypothetical protein [Propionicimonas sp.]